MTAPIETPPATDAAAPSVCIIGSGPSGLYAADQILRKAPTCRVDVIDRLPTPFGLVRAGVAPDHQGTKNIVRQFERTLSKPNARFLGNITVGRDVTLDELRGLYDATILAVGAPLDRTLGIPGEDLDGVYGSGAFVGWYNGHPDHAGLKPRLSKSIAVIGNGNVALDIARILGKTADEMTGSDICTHAADSVAAAPIADIWLIGRRGPVEASFTSAELAELGHLSRARPVVDASLVNEAALPDDLDPKDAKVKEKNLEILREFATLPTDDRPIRIHLLFNAAPTAISGDASGAAKLTVERTQVVNGRAQGTGEMIDIEAGTIITAIGYRTQALDGMPMDASGGRVANADGHVTDDLWVVGWAKRGPSGVIPTNRADSISVADQVVAALPATSAKAGPAGLDAVLNTRSAAPVSLDGWQTINAAEVARAADGRPREKFVHIADMLATLTR